MFKTRILIRFYLVAGFLAYIHTAYAQDSSSEEAVTDPEALEPEVPETPVPEVIVPETPVPEVIVPEVQDSREDTENVVVSEQPVQDVSKNEDPKWEIRGQVHPRYELSHQRDGVGEGEDAFANEFLIRRARLKVAWTPNDIVRGVINIGLDQTTDIGPGLLKDAYIRLNLAKYLKIRFGQFKKPFSGLELQSSRKLKVLERGEGNGLIIDDLGYGDRDLGLQLSGRLLKSIKLDYAVGVFNGSGPNVADPTNSKDVTARLELRPIKALQFGVNGSFKFFDDGDLSDKNALAAGGDLQFSFFGFRLFFEAIAAQSHLYWAQLDPLPSAPIILNLISVLSYRYRSSVSWGLDIEPLVKAELLDPNTDIVDDEVLVLGPGLNFYLGQYLRLMMQVEFRRSSRNSTDDYPDSDVFMLQLCLDI